MKTNKNFSEKELKYIGKKLQKLLKITTNMSLEEKEKFKLKLSERLIAISEELNMIERTTEYIKQDNLGYVPQSKRNIISLVIEMSACLVGGIVGGLTPSLNFLLGVAYGFLISVPVSIIVDLNIETKFIKSILTKIELKIYNHRKNKLNKEKVLTEKTFEMI